MSVKNFNSLLRFDFTSECKTCEYRKQLGLLEYCCSFVYDLLKEEKLLNLKKNIMEYILNDDELDKIDYHNIFFSDDITYNVTISFKTNLTEDKHLIVTELKKALNDSIYFKDVSIKEDVLYKELEDSNKLVKSRLIEYLEDKESII